MLQCPGRGGGGEVGAELELYPLPRSGIYDPHQGVGARRADQSDAPLHRA
jgi:hypothetical protein